MPDKKDEAAKPAEAQKPAATPSGGGGIKPMLPLILNVVLMPVMAYVMTVFFLLPKVNSAGITAHAKSEGETVEAAEGHGEAESTEESGGHGGGKEKITATLSSKILVNVAGTMGTRYLLVNIIMVGKSPALKEKVEKSDFQLRDVAASLLAAKTIADIDKPGARNLIRSELISAFNNILGDGIVKEIYFTEFAIQ